MVPAILPQGPTNLPFPPDSFELVADLLDPSLHRLVVRVDALLAARHESRPLADVRFMNPLSQQRDLVLEEGELDLELPVSGPRALCEQLKQHAETIVAFDVEFTFEDMMHRSSELAVEDDNVDVRRLNSFLKLLEFAAADERSRIRSVPPLKDCLDDAMAGRGQEGADLVRFRVEGDEQDVQRSGPGPGPSIRISTGSEGVGVVPLPLANHQP